MTEVSDFETLREMFTRAGINIVSAEGRTLEVGRPDYSNGPESWPAGLVRFAFDENGRLISGCAYE